MDKMTEKAIRDELFVVSDTNVVFNGVLGRVYIPEKNFKRGVSEMVDVDVQTIGIFKLLSFDSLDVPYDDGEQKFIKHELVFKIPMTIKMCPTRITEVIKTEISESDDESEMERVKYYVLEFNKGDRFIKSLNAQKHVKNLKSITSMITDNQLPKEIGYTDVAKLWTECSEINGYGSMKTNTAELELIISEIYRNPYDLSQPFRLYLAKNPGADISSAKPIRVVDIAKNVSAFGSISSGDPVRGITSSIIRQRKGLPDAKTPIEEQIR